MGLKDYKINELNSNITLKFRYESMSYALC